MSLFPLFADISPLPFLLFGGTFLLVVGGVFLAVAVAMFGVIKRRRDQRRRSDSDRADDRLTEEPESQQ